MFQTTLLLLLVFARGGLSLPSFPPINLKKASTMTTAQIGSDTPATLLLGEAKNSLSEVDEDYDFASDTGVVVSPNSISEVDSVYVDYEAFANIRKLINEATLLAMCAPAITHLLHQQSTTPPVNRYTPDQVNAIVCKEMERNSHVLGLIDAAQTEMEKHPNAAELCRQIYAALNEGFRGVRVPRDSDTVMSMKIAQNVLSAAGLVMTFLNMIIGTGVTIFNEIH